MLVGAYWAKRYRLVELVAIITGLVVLGFNLMHVGDRQKFPLGYVDVPKSMRETDAAVRLMYQRHSD